MQILRPGSTFKLVWQVSVPGDETTYYPQAVIKTSLDGAVLDTVDLSLESAGRYSASWRVPNDRTGQGTQIDVTLTVYTDSGHTAKSGDYQVENEVYNIWDLASLMRGGGFGSATESVDYKKISKLIKEQIETIAIPNYSRSIGELGNVLDDITRQMAGLKRQVSDQGALFGQVAELKGFVEKFQGQLAELKQHYARNHEVLSEQMLTGLQNLTETLGQAADRFAAAAEELKQGQASLLQEQAGLNGIPDDLADIGRTVKKMIKVFSQIQTVTVKQLSPMDLEGMPEPEPEVPAKKGRGDYKNLANSLIT